MLAIVTGTSRGLGFEIARQFSKNPKNLVIAVSRNPVSLHKLLSKSGTTNLLPVKANVSENEHIKVLVRLVKKLGLPVDVLVNNAATLIKKPFESLKPADFEESLQANLISPFLVSQALVPYMNQKEGSHIVNIGSMGGVQGSAKFPGLIAYSTSKAALAGMSECMAEELRPKNISVNCLALGSVQTEMLAQAFPGYKAPLDAKKMAAFVCDFAERGHRFFNGKILPVSSSTP